ncbi:MAG TPA: hypothetical protein DCY20_04905, partial [Firmicutes bacterium]|nr:hypothetical protein [Bacillota bacterium]
MATDEATSQNLYLPPRYFFVKEGTPYSSVTLDKTEVSEGENLVATVSVKNLENGSTFEYPLTYFRGFEVQDIRVNADLQEILDENGYTATIDRKFSGTIMRMLELTLKITDENGNNVNISGDISLLDVEYKLVDDSEAEFYREYIQAASVTVFDKDGNYADMSYGTTYEGVDIIQTTSTIRGVQVGQGFIDASSRNKYSDQLDQYIWVEDSQGNRYDLEYYDAGMEYLNFDLPVSTEPYKLVTDLPGHFKKEAHFLAYREVDGEIIGKTYYLMGSEYYKYALAGDINKDGVVDILDALLIKEYYGKKVDDITLGVDFNFDGIVNADDMDYIIYNFLESNEQNSNTPEPKEIAEGKTLEDILNEVGYYEEVRLDSLSISEVELTLELNDSENNTAQLSATMNPENVPNIELVWKSQYDSVATVDQNGLVTAVNPGMTTISVAASDGSVILFCYVTVTKDGMIPSFSIAELKNPVVDLKVGDELPLDFEAVSADAVVKSIVYTSSAESIVEVVNGVAVAKSVGTAWVTVNINSGEAFAT